MSQSETEATLIRRAEKLIRESMKKQIKLARHGKKEEREREWKRELILRRMLRTMIEASLPRVEEPDDEKEIVEIIDVSDVEEGVKREDSVEDIE